MTNNLTKSKHDDLEKDWKKIAFARLFFILFSSFCTIALILNFIPGIPVFIVTPIIIITTGFLFITMVGVSRLPTKSVKENKKRKFFKLGFLFNFLLLIYLEYLFFLTLSQHFYPEAFLLQPVYCLPFIVSLSSTFLEKKWKKRIIGFYLVWLFIGVPFLFYEFSIKINSKTNPKYTFWCKVDNIPSKQETIDIFNELDIDLIIPVNVDDFNQTHKDKIQNLIDNEVKIYLSLVGYMDFPNIDNHQSVLETYYYLRTLDFFNNLSGFYIDAEPYMSTINKFIELEWYEVIPFLISRFPSINEIENATLGYQKLINEVHKDDKTIGIVKNLEFGCYIDTAFGNIYHLKLNWDLEIFMHYRISAGGGYRRFTDFEMYDTISYYDGEVMLGSFKSGYEWNEMITDITICSHFNKKRIYFFSWGTFEEKFGVESLRDLKPYESYTIKYSMWDATWRFLYYHGIDWGNIIVGFFV